MKAWPVLSVFVLAGCRSGGIDPIVASFGPQEPHLTQVGHNHTNGTLTGLDFTWDLGSRPLREVRLAGMASIPGEAEGKTRRTTLKVSLRALKKDRVKATVAIQTVEEGGSGTVTTSTDVSIKGGLEAVQQTKEDPAATKAKKLILLRWKDPEARTDSALTVTFR